MIEGWKNVSTQVCVGRLTKYFNYCGYGFLFFMKVNVSKHPRPRGNGKMFVTLDLVLAAQSISPDSFCTLFLSD